ncbi:MAG: nicotinate phosphoribosyltransferase [Spirochaetes bacterium]|nr:MAG: nicotinate phosphoribosyltransferase [Spirochaetota bacterium]
MKISDAVKPILATDGYKIQHIFQYPKGTEYVYSNWTARGSRVEGVDKVVFVGLQSAIQQRLMEDFEPFFAADVDEVCAEYARVMEGYMGPVPIDHIRALHNLGYIPLEFKALPEGTHVPLRVPMFTVENTHPDFFWLTNYFETILSADLWMPMTSATNAGRIRGLLNEWAVKTGAPLEGIGFQGHDFSMRGMAGADAANLSGMGHLVAFTGTETVPVMQYIQDYYPFDGFLAGTVPATEHSVMCAGGDENERETFQRLLDLYPEGILSVVSDTWDFWRVLTEHLPALKDQIMARDGKLVIRPDSGDPADIVCGTMAEEWADGHSYNKRKVYRKFGTGSTPEEKGAYEILWDIFGGTINEKGYKVLDPHVGVIYGDAMNYDRIQNICARLEAKGFSIESMVFGLGSYGYQYQTRDTFGFAMKATNVTIDGEDRAIFKDPVTDSGLKKSLKGRIQVMNHSVRGLVSVDDDYPRTREALNETGGDLLETVWKDGKFMKTYSFDEVRANAGFVV